MLLGGLSEADAWAAYSGDRIDDIITDLESRGLGWDIGHTSRLREVRIWQWPNVIARYRPTGPEPLVDMLTTTLKQIDLRLYPITVNCDD